MAKGVTFTDNSRKFIAEIEDATKAALEEAAGEIESAAKMNSAVVTGKTKSSYKHHVNGDTATIGSDLENAVCEEFGTGEYAVKGGRKGYWVFVKGSTKKSGGGKSYTLKEAKRVMAMLRAKGLDAYYTKGKQPKRPLERAFNKVKPKIEKYFSTHFKGID